jgi:DNA-binding CsgD family transcriptional regulator
MNKKIKDDEELIRLFRAGHSLASIGRYYGLSRQRIYQKLCSLLGKDAVQKNGKNITKKLNRN